ncbi:hypothetical protein C2G38_154392 [Gigaspora rosea]|uniref:Uncharacterized protein n=1 Tax=Gigaspora rosea TaxID=44941 RepID=A0A397UL46_9GLOM|nr:hypothetical protein C2G38_154392 [Gigaspora rosea]
MSIWDITKYFAISPEGDFIVEFDKIEFKLQAYIVELDNDSSIEDDHKLSRKKLSLVSTTFEPTDKSLLDSFKDFKDKAKARWSIAVSDKLASTLEVRLLAISCIGFSEMTHYKDSSSIVMPKEIPENSNVKPEEEIPEIPENGRNSVLIINKINNNNNYSVSFIDGKELPIRYGGIVKLFSKQDHQKDEKDKQTIGENCQNVEHFLILLKVSGIYKYHIDMNKSISNIQKLKYPRRLYKAMINNINMIANETYKYIFTCDYLKASLNRYYFLVDTMIEDNGYIELYDLRTNQLVNTFQRQILSKELMVETLTLSYAISNNNKLLAYISKTIKGIVIYSIECSFKIVELADILTETSSMIIEFFHNDEKLLIYRSENEWTVWNIYGSFRDSVKLENPGPELEVQIPLFKDDAIERSNSFIVANEGNKLVIYDDLIIDKYLKHLKTNGEQVWSQPSWVDKSELDEYYNVLEPWWLFYPIDSRHSFFLDEKKRKIAFNWTPFNSSLA